MGFVCCVCFVCVFCVCCGVVVWCLLFGGGGLFCLFIFFIEKATTSIIHHVEFG